MYIAIGICIGVLIFVLFSFVKMLNSTRDVIITCLGIVILYGALTTGHIEWWAWIWAILTLVSFVKFFNDRTKEKAILLTVLYVMNSNNAKRIFIQEINEKLGYKNFDFVKETMEIYKKKALIPYDVELYYHEVYQNYK